MAKSDFKAGIRSRYLAVFDEVKQEESADDKGLSTILGIPASHISMMRSGKRTPTLEQIVEICEKYGYDMVYVIRGDDTEGERRPITKASLQDIYKEVRDLKGKLEDLMRRLYKK